MSLSVTNVGHRSSRNTSGKHSSSLQVLVPVAISCCHLHHNISPDRTEAVLFDRIFLFPVVENCYHVLPCGTNGNIISLSVGFDFFSVLMYYKPIFVAS